MFRTISWALTAVILLVMPAAIQAALINTTTGATMWSDSFETGTVGSAPLATEPLFGSYVTPVFGDVKIANAASAGFPAYEGTQFMQVTRDGGNNYVMTHFQEGSIATGEEFELTIAFHVTGLAGAIRFLKDDTFANIVQQITFYNGYNDPLEPPNGTVAFYNGAVVAEFDQTFTPDAWNVLVIKHVNGGNDWSFSVNGQTPETATGRPIYSTLDVTGFVVLGADTPSTMSVDGLPVLVPGDVNFDGVVNIFDINLVSAHWGESGPTADANGDMAVNIFDINLISSNWTTGGGASAAAVPEPGTLGLLAMGLAIGGYHMRRRQRRTRNAS